MRFMLRKCLKIPLARAWSIQALAWHGGADQRLQWAIAVYAPWRFKPREMAKPIAMLKNARSAGAGQAK
jgi:hypothetical protein